MDTSGTAAQPFNIDPVFSTADPVAAAQQAQQQAIAQKRENQAVAAAQHNGSPIDSKGDLNPLPHLSNIFAPGGQPYTPQQQQQQQQQNNGSTTNGSS